MQTGSAAIDINGGLISLDRREIELLRKRYGKRITVAAQTLISMAVEEAIKAEEAKEQK